MTDFPRLIEFAFPLKQASLDSVHEKNVRHGHISTLHIWPARRPLAACRAALIATLLPDPSAEPKPQGLSDQEWQKEVQRRRRELCERIGGRIVKRIERKKMPNGRIVEREKEATEGGVLHWHGQPKNKADREAIEQQKRDLEWFRNRIREVYGRPPKVLDPFAGGGSIPLEAMRLGCEATAVDINPVAWFILKCTLEYPQKLAGQTRPLPDFILRNEAFMREFFMKAKGYSAAEATKALQRLGRTLKEGEQAALDFAKGDGVDIEADLAWHVRAWGQWVLDRARRELARFYPVYADFEPHKPGHKSYEPQPMRLVPLHEDGTPEIDALNGDFSREYLADKRNPRWVAKPTVAYLWARTVPCKNCRMQVPLLKTRWLCKKANKRVLLTMEVVDDPDAPGGRRARFGVQTDVPLRGGNAAQRREHDRRIGAGTMSRAGATCPHCGTIMTMEDLRSEGKAGRLGVMPTAVVVDGPRGKEYRLPTDHEIAMAAEAARHIDEVFAEIPFGVPTEPLPPENALGIRVPKYGFKRWCDLFTPRQLLALGVFVREARHARRKLSGSLPTCWSEAVSAYLAALADKVIDRSSRQCIWICTNAEKASGSFGRFALPITWDHAEIMPWSESAGGFPGLLEHVAEAVSHALDAVAHGGCRVCCASALSAQPGVFDVIVTDPPYYDAIPYSDLMDFFYVWLRRLLGDCKGEASTAFAEELGPKWDPSKGDGELIDDDSRHARCASASRDVYESGMYQAFQAAAKTLAPHGRFVIVFAHKDPDAWESLVSAIVRAGFVVDGSWPIQTERGGRIRAQGSAALASSVWLVCKKRPADAPVGWDNRVLEEMRISIRQRLRDFWDAGIRGPDFVWAATGPALEAYSKHPAVRKANQPNAVMSVSEFLSHVRRIVVDFVVGRVLSGDGEADAAVEGLDKPTAYYLLHRYDFGLDEAPMGAVILYAVSCGLSDRELIDTWDLITATGGSETEKEADPDAEEVDEEGGSGSRARLKTWAQRKRKTMGYEAPGGRPVPLIDRVHRLMHLWRAGDVNKVDAYLDEHSLRRHELFKRLLQSLIELSPPRSEERSLLESLSNHVGALGARREKERGQVQMADEEAPWTAPVSDTE